MGDKYLDCFEEYLLRHHRSDLLDILKHPVPSQSFSVTIDFFTLFEEVIELGSCLLTNPDETLEIFNRGLLAAQQRILKDASDAKKDSLLNTSSEECSTVVGRDYCTEITNSVDDIGTVKNIVHTRITGLPANVQDKRAFPENDDNGLFVQISGNVVRVTLPCLQEYGRNYICLKCGTAQYKEAEYELSNALLPPQKCVSGCANAKFTHVKEEGKEKLKDYQEIRVQEDLGKIHLGSVPASIWVTLDHDLVDVCHPGDHVTIWGTVKRRWKSWKTGTLADVEIVLKGNYVQVTNHQKAAKLVTPAVRGKIQNFWSMYTHNPLKGRDVILASFCPDMYGVYVAKLALMVVLCGGCECEDIKVRSQPHMLLVGDPGTGKSHLLRFAAKVATRSVITTGVGSTTAGLTVCAVREGSDWQLEAGALVLADGGVCCIDELNTMKEHDRASLHEAMEQQTISVAKAGMVSKVSTRCTVLAATNAKQGGYNTSESLSENTSLGSPLLSRFDLVLVMQDTRNAEWDSMLSSFILGLTEAPTSGGSADLWTTEDLQMYLAYARTFSPKIGPAAHMVLTTYYQAQRAVESRNAARTTVRMLESLVRLSQGHARLMLREMVTTEDAVVTITLMECSMGSCALTGSADALKANFPDNPLHLYRQQATLVLQKLELEDILHAELSRLDLLENELPKEPTIAHVPLVPPPNFALSQRLNTLITDIRRKKDLETCQAAGFHGSKRVVGKINQVKRPQQENKNTKRTNPTTNLKKMKRKMILSDSDDDAEEKGPVKKKSADDDIVLNIGEIPESPEHQTSFGDVEPTASENRIFTGTPKPRQERRTSLENEFDPHCNKSIGPQIDTFKPTMSAFEKLQKFKKDRNQPISNVVTKNKLDFSVIESQDVVASFKAVSTSTPNRPQSPRHAVEQTETNNRLSAPDAGSGFLDKTAETEKAKHKQKIKELIRKSVELSQKSEEWSREHVQSQSQSQFTLNVTWDHFLDEQVNLDF